jgi:DNA-binding transcriptional ArsR family regulator
MRTAHGGQDQTAAHGDHDLAAIAMLIGDRSRASMLSVLLGGRASTGVELARAAGVASSTASEHLTKLVDANLVVVEPAGRHRYYTLASPAVAEALERLGALAPAQDVNSLRQSNTGHALRRARSCYDHLAGQVGTALADSLQCQHAIIAHEGSFEVTETGTTQLYELGIDVDTLRSGRRAFARCCLDWSERRHHVAGALGAALLAQFIELDWLRRQESSRALQITPAGRASFHERWGITD